MNSDPHQESSRIHREIRRRLDELWGNPDRPENFSDWPLDQQLLEGLHRSLSRLRQQNSQNHHKWQRGTSLMRSQIDLATAALLAHGGAPAEEIRAGRGLESAIMTLRFERPRENRKRNLALWRAGCWVGFLTGVVLTLLLGGLQ
jgi:hypothetical protein